MKYLHLCTKSHTCLFSLKNVCTLAPYVFEKDN